MYLALLAVALVAGCALRLLDAGVAGFSSARGLGETTGGVITLFLVAALVSTVQILVYRKPIASALSPTVVGIVALAAFALLSYRGLEAERTLTSPQAPDSQGGETLVKYVDQQHGFLVYYEGDWIRREPNEKETKLIVVSPTGNRCWITVVDNPNSTGVNAKDIVATLIRTAGGSLRLRCRNVTLTPTLPQSSCSHIGALSFRLFSYSYRHRTIDVDEIIAVLQAHTPTKGFTYEIGCSTVSDGDLASEFENEEAIFFRSFMLIPRQD